MNTESTRDELMHYHRTCLNCGENWWGLHCPHDGIQNPCSACDVRPNTVPTKNGCDCEFIMPESDLDTYLDQQIAEVKDMSTVDRFEVIDETGRAYVKGSIYGSPVKIELSKQDESRTLKVFVSARLTKDNNKETE